MKDYTFERLWKELDEGFQIYYIYMGKKYLLTKLKSNCYLKELVSFTEKSAHPKKQMITLKTVKELFEFMEDIEYKA